MTSYIKSRNLFSPNTSVDSVTTAIVDDNSPLFFARVATTKALETNTYSSGVITASSNGALQNIYTDSVSLSVGDYILVKNEASQLKNGIYSVTALGDGSNPWVLTRITEYSTTAEIYPSQVNILEGIVNISNYFLQTTVNPTIGTDPIVYVAKSFPSAGISGLTFVDTLTNTILPNSPTYTSGTNTSFPALNAIYTATTNGAFPTLNAVTPFNGMKVLVKDEVDQTKNGDYTLVNVGSASSKWKLKRISWSSTLLYPRAWEITQGTVTGAIYQQNNRSLVNNSIGTSGNITFTNIESASGFVPYTGASTDVDLGVHKIDGNSTTQSPGNNTTKIATTAYVDSAVAAVSSLIPITQLLYVDPIVGSDDTTTGRGDINKPYATVEYALSHTTNSGTLTVGTTNNSNSLTATSTTGVVVGQYITGAGIPYGSTVISFVTNTSITLSKKCTATASITATYYTYMVIKLSGIITWATNWYKEGFGFDAGSSTIFFSGKVFDRGTNVRLTPEYIIGGYWYGTASASQLYSYGNASSPNHEMLVKLCSYYSIGTGYQFGDNNSSSFIFANKITIDCPVFDCRFGSISYMSANNCQWKGYKYGLLGGITIINGSGYFESNGEIETPSNINAINCTSATNIVVSDNILGSVWCSHNGGATFNGSIDGSTIQAGTINYWSHNFNGPIYRPTITTAGNVNIHSFELGTVNHSQGTLTVEFGNGTFNVSGGTMILNGTHRTDFAITLNVTSTGYVILNGNSGQTAALSTISIASGCTVECNGNYAFRPKDATGAIAGTLIVNKGATYIWDYNNGSTETITGTINIYGTIKLTQSFGSESSSTTPTIKLTTGTVLVDGGRLECTVAGSKSGLIRKQADGGKVILKGQPYLKVANGLAPIQILSNTGTAQDIFDFSLIDNCAVSFRLANTFSDTTYGTAYAPNLLIGGTLYEATTNSW